jgi:stress response protein SCP2
MTTAVLARGANTAISDQTVDAVVTWRAGSIVDPCALLVTASGKVRSDADFVFYNQPSDESGAVRLTADQQGSATLAVDLARIPVEVTKVIVAGSMESGTFDTVPGLQVTVNGQHGRRIANFPIVNVEPVAAVVFGELYRRGEGWKFRAVGQGWDAGLAGLVRHYGVTVEEDADSTQTPPVPAQPTTARTTMPARPATPAPRPDWYAAPENPSILRWWTGTEWSSQSVPLVQDSPTVCGRCGRPKHRSMFVGGTPSCPSCEAEIANTLNVWRNKAAHVLASTGTSGREWDALWAELRYYRVREDNGRGALRPVALHHLQQLLTFAYADDIIEQHEVDGFDEAVRELGIADPAITDMRRRLQRGLELGLISNGDVPRITQTNLSIEADEILHLEVPAVQVRYLANGPRRSNGRLIATNAKLRFVGHSGGSALNWTNVLEARPEYANVVVAVTTARGGGSYEVTDPEYVVAVLTGVLKIAKRLAATPQQRASRAVPPGVRAEVWRRDGGACVECGATEYLEFDHVIPWSRGGATSAGNLQLLCRGCNLAKGARI